MGPADLDNVFELLGLRRQRVAQFPDRREQPMMDHFDRRDMHRARKGIVGGLRHVDVVIGMDGLLAAHHPACELDGAVGDDLVGVHVGLGAAAGLPDMKREMVVERALDHLVGGLDHELGLVSGQHAEVLVDLGGGLLEDTKSADQFARHDVVADIEMKQRALGLRSPVTVGLNLDRPHAVGFGPSSLAM